MSNITNFSQSHFLLYEVRLTDDGVETEHISIITGLSAEIGPQWPYRSSPIYPTSSEVWLPDRNADWQLSLFEFDTPFQVIARVQARAPEVASRLWFSLGLCSCILVSDRPEDYTTFVEVASTPRRSEAWQVSGTVLTTRPPSSALATVPSRAIQFNGFESLDIEVRGLVGEFCANIQIALGDALVYAPSEVEAYEGLIGIVQSIVADLAYIENPDTTPLPPGLQVYGSEKIARDDAFRSSLTNHRIDQLVQLNSSLSYVTSQAYSGGSPVLRTPSVIRRYGLLGVGAAHRALVAVARTIEKAFENNSVEAVIREQFATAAPLPGFDHPIDYDPSQWQPVCGVDKFLAAGGFARPNLRKLAFFSGRLGFRETQFSISSALQVLFAGDGRAWSLSTMTHEMMHGHVRNLLGAIFAGRPGEPDARKKQRIYNTFARHMRGIGNEQFYAVDSIRSVILSYACLTYEVGSLTRQPRNLPIEGGAEVLQTELVLLPPELLRRQFESEFRNINEIFVLVLDLHYFYRSQLTIYLQGVWQSWSSVPGVVRDLRQYVLRSLLSAASMPDSVGDAQVRFDKAVEEVQNSLIPLGDAGRHGSLVSTVLESLGNPDEMVTLVEPFAVSLRVVDLVKRVFFSRIIRGQLFSSDMLTDGDLTTRDAALTPGIFTDLPIESPLALMGERVAAALTADERTDLEYASAWLLLACASSSYTSGGMDVD
jgi:hypothetical protein